MSFSDILMTIIAFVAYYGGIFFIGIVIAVVIYITYSQITGNKMFEKKNLKQRNRCYHNNMFYGQFLSFGMHSGEGYILSVVGFVKENGHYKSKIFQKQAVYHEIQKYEEFEEKDLLLIKFENNDFDIISKINIADIPKNDLIELQTNFPQYFGVVSESYSNNKCAVCGANILNNEKICNHCGSALY